MVDKAKGTSDDPIKQLELQMQSLMAETSRKLEERQEMWEQENRLRDDATNQKLEAILAHLGSNQGQEIPTAPHSNVALVHGGSSLESGQSSVQGIRFGNTTPISFSPRASASGVYSPPLDVGVSTATPAGPLQYRPRSLPPAPVLNVTTAQYSSQNTQVNPSSHFMQHRSSYPNTRTTQSDTQPTQTGYYPPSPIYPNITTSHQSYPHYPPNPTRYYTHPDNNTFSTQIPVGIPFTTNTHHQSTITSHDSTSASRLMKIKLSFPEFDAHNPRGWIRRCDRFFEVYQVPEESKMTLISMHAKDKMDHWFDSFMIERGGLVSWADFCIAVCRRYGNIRPFDIVKEFNHLKQLSDVESYHSKFEELRCFVLMANPLLNEQYFVNCFVGGLKPELESMVRY